MVKMRKTWARPQLVVAELAHIYISTRARVGAGGVIDVDECVATAVEARFEEEASEERRRCRRRRRREEVAGGGRGRVREKSLVDVALIYLRDVSSTVHTSSTLDRSSRNDIKSRSSVSFMSSNHESMGTAW